MLRVAIIAVGCVLLGAWAIIHYAAYATRRDGLRWHHGLRCVRCSRKLEPALLPCDIGSVLCTWCTRELEPHSTTAA